MLDHKKTYNILLEKLEKELDIVYVGDDVKVYYRNIFKSLTLNLLLLEPQKITLEITFEESISYKMQFNNKIVFFEAYVQTEDHYEIIYSIYNDKDNDKSLICPYYGNTENSLKQLKEDINEN